MERTRLIAYALATVMHETAFTFHPIDEYGSTKYFEDRYGSQTNVGRELGNDTREEGAKYHGRGYVQLTGENNYERAQGELLKKAKILPPDSVVENPALVKRPDIAFAIMTYGMFQGWFTGRKFSDFITPNQTDYKNARRIINGKDKAELIAGYAVKFEEILKNSLLSN